MRANLPDKNTVMLGAKIVVGTAIAANAIGTGAFLGGCPVEWCVTSVEFYAMRSGVWSVVATCFGGGLLISAFWDLLIGHGQLNLPASDVEAVAALGNSQVVFDGDPYKEMTEIQNKLMEHHHLEWLDGNQQ